MLFALVLAGIAEGFGLTALLPLLGLAFSRHSQSAPDQWTGLAGNDSGVGHTVTEGLKLMGLEPSAAVFLMVLVLAIILKSGLILLAKKRVGYTVAQVATELRLTLLRELLVARWEYFLRQPVGSLANSIASEAMRASNAYLNGALMTASLIQAMVYVTVALLVSWKAMLACLAAGCIIIVVLGRLVRKAKRAGVRQTKVLQSLLAHLTDSLQSIKPLKSMAREEFADSLLQTETNRLNKAMRKQVMIYLDLSLASVVTLAFLLARLMSQLGKVQRQYQNMMIAESAFWSMQDKIQDARKNRETASGGQTATLEKEIRLEGVSFEYEKDLRVLQNASLVFPAGSFTTIVGVSGTGKTTVVDLVIGLLQPQAGKIWVDDLPLAEIDLRRWRKMIGYVPQDTVLLHDSVRLNVTLGDPSLNEEDVVHALRAAGAWDFVSAMPQGMDSSVGERGGKLSGGQRQRIAVARALVQRPRLLILDEATSALDPESEVAIGRTLQELSGNLTIIAISHQPALAKSADRAYRLQDGKAVLIDNPNGNSSQPTDGDVDSTVITSS
jgi:ATP-binding cassette subfamily C protein